MRYVSGLIPDHLKVMPEYFRETDVNESGQRPFFSALSYLGAMSLFILGLSFYNHILLTVYYGFIGLIVLPQGHSYIEKKGRFLFTKKIKALIIVSLLLLSIPVTGAYISADVEAKRLAEIEAQKAEELRLEKERLELLRQDSFNSLINAVIVLKEENKLKEAEEAIGKAKQLAVLPKEKATMAKEAEQLSLATANNYIKKHRYKDALPLFVQLARSDPGDADIVYNKALCYQKLGEIQEAVTELKIAMRLGSSKAKNLHEKINPVRKRIIGYRTLCCDGTYSPSNAKGRGACSWHGGVCNWNAPVYEKYRKYQ